MKNALAFALILIGVALVAIGAYERGKHGADKWWENRWLEEFSQVENPKPCPLEPSLWTFTMQKREDGSAWMWLGEYAQSPTGIVMLRSQHFDRPTAEQTTTGNVTIPLLRKKYK